MEKFPQEDASDRAYRTSIKAKACDILRGLLPAATTTNVGLFGNGRSFEYLITKMYSSEFKEARDLATAMHEELMKSIPSFVKRASGKYGDPTIEFLSETRKDMQALADKTFGGMEPENKEDVVLTNYDKEAEEKVIAAALYPFTDLTFEQIKEKVMKMSEEERLNVVKTYQEKRQNRRHKPNRGFEHAYYEFDLICNYASYRDLHRHRMLTQQRQDLGVKHGYDVPPEALEIGFEKEFKEQMGIAADAYKTIYPDFRRQSQYVVPFAYRIRWNNYLNLRELYHLVELRSTIHGHPDYRRIVIKMHEEVKKVHPALVEYMKYIDYREVGLERLESEKKTDKKMKEVEQKYGASNP
ncbi:FAD-dependent thymidylate synthase [archaeon]|nr:FAD-dependent thymidylate synthase [archaeon]